MRQLLLATHNEHKLEELRRIIAALAPELPDLEVVGLDDIGPFDAPKETGATFVENAVLKARTAASQCDLITIADDSGITIDALNGMPGVLSARWAGQHGTDEADEANVRLVLAQLADVPDDRLGAAFVCAAALVVPGTNRGKVAEERMLGHVIREPRGSNGFGYDPIFVALGESVTNAELAPERKDQISHRAKALRALVPYIKTALGDPASVPVAILPEPAVSEPAVSEPAVSEPAVSEPAISEPAMPAAEPPAESPATALPSLPAPSGPPISSIPPPAARPPQ